MTLKPPINHCKICFKEIKNDELGRLINNDICVCINCQKLLDPKFIRFKVDRYEALSIYEYSDFIKNQTYLFKGCYDIEMKDVFINLFLKELKVLCKGYTIIPIPSYEEDNLKRGFNHVEEVFKQLNLPILKIIEKTAHFKQAENSAKDRKSIGKYLKLNTTENLEKRKVIIVDDIYTTGATMNAAINLVEKLNPKEIKVLVLAKTKNKNEKKLIQI